MIELRNLCLNADGITIMRNITLKIPRGQTLALDCLESTGPRSITTPLLQPRKAPPTH